MKLPNIDASTWAKGRGPMLATQLYLIGLAAFGQLDFLRLVFTYYLECSMAMLVVVFFYSDTLRIAFQSVLEWIGKNFAVGIVILFIYLTFQNSDLIPLDTLFDKANQNLLGPIQSAAMYCVIQFSWGWIVSRQAPCPKNQFFVFALYPASFEPLAASLMVMLPVSAMASHFAGEHPSEVTVRVVAVILTAAYGLSRELFSYILFPLTMKDGGEGITILDD